MANLSAIRGFRDYFGEDLSVMEEIESVSRDTLELAGFEPIRLTIFE
jgi:histidyl-tRNA synthetase